MTRAERTGTRLAGRYELQRVIGRGGMATVYAARDDLLGRDVAVKAVDAAASEPNARQRFVREAQATARLRHPNAVAIYDAGESDGLLYIVMELVHGHSLAAELADRGPLAAAHAQAIGAAVLAVLAEAHAAGIVHRDVKPSNIMLTDDGQVKLLDFGIARELDRVAGTLTEVGHVIGTPMYLSPEQVTGRPASPASDLYAVGVVLFEMLAGSPPFRGDTPVATAQAHVMAPVPDVRGRRADVPEALAAVIARALAKDPGERFHDAAEMGAALVAVRPAAAAVTTTAAYLHVPGPARPRRRTPVWPSVVVGAFVAVLIAAMAWAVVQRDDPAGLPAEPTPTTGLTPGATSVAPAAIVTTVAVTAAPTTPPTTPSTTPSTTPAPTSVAPTTTPPETVAQLIAMLAAEPDRFGERTREIVEQLEKIEEGDKEDERARDLLDKLDEWLEDETVTPEAVALIEPVLEPLAERSNGRGNGRDDD